MANIADTAGIFVGSVLEAFNQMQFVVARDGDLAYAQSQMLTAMQKIGATQGVATAGLNGQTVKRRS